MSKPFLATDLEVVTTTPTGVVISWITRQPSRLGMIPAPAPAGTQLWLGPLHDQLRLVHDDPTPRVFHQVEITGLEPGREYHFRALSDGVVPVPGLLTTRTAMSPERTHVFTTLLPPPGRYLTTIALANDIHIGEPRQGIVLGALPTSVAPGEGQEHYPEIMLQSMLRDLRTKHGSPFLLLGGDITYHNSADEVARVRQILNQYGQPGTHWLAIRGNHDHPRPHDDPFGQIVGYQHMTSTQLPSGLRILGIDTTRGSGGGWITESQYDQIAAFLKQDRDRPTLATSHHPVTNDAARTAPSGPQFMLRAPDRSRLQRLEATAHGVFLHHTGHTHRMRRGVADVVGTHTEYFENAACAAYPGGYALLHLYEGGYLLNFWRISTPEALRWSYRSRWQVLGFAAEFTLGTTGDRNHVKHVDLSGLVAQPGPAPAELVG